MDTLAVSHLGVQSTETKGRSADFCLTMIKSLYKQCFNGNLLFFKQNKSRLWWKTIRRRTKVSCYASSSRWTNSYQDCFCAMLTVFIRLIKGDSRRISVKQTRRL